MLWGNLLDNRFSESDSRAGGSGSVIIGRGGNRLTFFCLGRLDKGKMG